MEIKQVIAIVVFALAFYGFIWWELERFAKGIEKNRRWYDGL